MRLAISNIAWNVSQDPHVADVLKSLEVEGIEVAPTKVWPRPLDVTEAEIASYRKLWTDRGIRIVALQSLLFGLPDLLLFGSASQYDEFREHLKGMIRLGWRLGASILVFGSPKNRWRGTLGSEMAFDLAVPRFRELGDYAAQYGSCLCIEPNPPQYGCDFVTNSEQGAELVKAVGSPGFGLHLDLACMQLVREDIGRQVARLAREIRHFHISAENLGPVGEKQIADCTGIFGILQGNGSSAWLSIEMRETAQAWATTTMVKDALRSMLQVEHG